MSHGIIANFSEVTSSQFDHRFTRMAANEGKILLVDTVIIR